MFAPARFPALALPEDVGGMLLDDGGVEVACTPLPAVASVARHDVVGAPPRELCVFGVVDAVKIFDGGGDDESRARLVVDLRSGPAPTDRCEAWFFGGAALGCRGLAAPGVALVAAKARLGWADGGYGVVKCWARAVVAAVDDATLAAAEAAGLGRKRPDWTAEQCVRAAASKLRALRAQRERSGAWAAASDVGDDVRAKRCWLCGDAWAPTRAAATRSARRSRSAAGGARTARGTRARARAPSASSSCRGSSGSGCGVCRGRAASRAMLLRRCAARRGSWAGRRRWTAAATGRRSPFNAWSKWSGS